MPITVLIHYNEIALKGGNRRFFEDKLVENIKNSLGFKKIPPNPPLTNPPFPPFIKSPSASPFVKGGLGGFVKNFYGRILVEIGEDADFEFYENKLKKVFGIANFSFCKVCSVPPVRFRLPTGDETEQYDSRNRTNKVEQIDEIKNKVWEFIKNKNFKSFKISAKRGDKSFPVDSQQINQIVGAFVQDKTKAKVDLDNPELTCFVEITSPTFLPLQRRGRKRRGWTIFIYDKKIKGAGGLPVGVSGKLISLISSGFDSPVASYFMAKRGAKVVFVHYHSYPETSLASRENVEELVKILSEYQAGSKIYFINILKIQKQIMLKAPEKFRVVLYRRAMVKIANEIAKRENAFGLVTGDSLGQVASQTLENLNTVTCASELPVYRPLIGFDKEEIIDLSKKIGFYEFSSRPYDDCCSLFVPQHPATRTEPEEIEKIEKGLKLEELQKRAAEEAETECVIPGEN